MLKKISLNRAFKAMFSRLPFIQQGVYSASANENDLDGLFNELTLFFIPSVSPICWDSPSELFTTTRNCFIKSLGSSHKYIIGHIIARVRSPKLNKPLYIAMSGSRSWEKAELVFLRGLGLGALGATIHGHIESERTIRHNLEFYRKRNQLTFIKFLVNDSGIARIMKFIDGFEHKKHRKFAPAWMYNGATWPRYENEGSGCSAFGMALLDVAHLIPEEADSWKMTIKIPMDLIGGKINKKKKIPVSKIKESNSWFQGDGEPDLDYIEHTTYDPSIIYSWCMKEYGNQTNGNTLTASNQFGVTEENGVPGLIKDCRDVIINPSEPVFLHREKTDAFTRQYFEDVIEMSENELFG